MHAVIGLGNPGPQYAATRHNAGFWVVERFATGSGGWRERGGSLFQRVMVGGEEVVLVLPQQYMNRSGQAAVGVVRFFKISPEDIVVVHDELDFDPGVVRVRLGGSAGGHNGVSDLIEHLGTQNFARVRIGIGHPRRAHVQQDTSAWVLSPPRPEERPVLEQATEDGCQAVRWIVERGVLAAQQEFNKRAEKTRGKEGG